ncbi:cytochrome d ubiquinol oxidase subunit II [Mucilaginibacter sp. SJ]|uniref:cytochrome d ubiquinol oxidase subunit II n=1 Tax=Mucilaginibacter sp. SJ TaxID=3029053 RepID=UPI0023A9CBA9|nr:cytochrome d ubiquinol oxidase subunit II [Mucilaginibacter sp. SJ]WEA01813.1 cytochrome d ubiquinol oxidase subunit II [Mucilaginibacter sp. SJ]
MLTVIIIFLWSSLLVYLLMGGADFGAGILELFARGRHRKGIQQAAYRAIGPIWEANHMWLIIAVVILFVGFPSVYYTVSIHLHIPLVIMLFGIIARGTAFTFRNYDAVHDQMQRVYDRIFIYSSFITPLFLGIIIGSAVGGTIDPGSSDFRSAYLDGWLNWFSVCVGFATVCLCGLLAAIYLIGVVSENNERRYLVRRIRLFSISLLGWGIAALMIAAHRQLPLAGFLWAGTLQQVMTCGSMVSLVMLWIALNRGKIIQMRLAAGGFLFFILVAATHSHYPGILLLKDGSTLSLLEEHAPERTITVLATALLGGSVLILPALVYLLYRFGSKE